MNFIKTSIFTIAMMTTTFGWAGENILSENVDKSVSPNEDFYDYACGGWIKAHPLTGEYSRFGSFDLLIENNVNRLNDIILKYANSTHEKGSVGQKISDLYNMAMDSVKLNKDGINPVMPFINKINSIKSKKELKAQLAELNMYGAGAYFQVFVAADPMSSKENMVQTYQGGTSLGEREYYLDEDEKTREIREKYKSHIVRSFELAGYSTQTATCKMEAVLAIETKLAEASSTNVELRDDRANYHNLSLKELQDIVPQINWKEYLSALGLKNTERVNASQIKFLKEVGEIINTSDLDTQKAYLEWKFIHLASPYMDDAIYYEYFSFFGKTLSGKETPRPRWKRAVSTVDGALGEAVGQIYVKEYFPPQAKDRMLQLVSNLQLALGDKIRNLDWMGDSTKTRALEKLDAFYVKIGYPDKWRSYDELSIEQDSYFANIIRSNQFDYRFNYSKENQPVDREEWLMTPQTVNAYYNPTTNEICFPAAILQAPFFDMNADDSFNYGAIGVVIGHEMTHGFDDQGCNFDKDGNLNNWWTESDKKNFDERASVLSDYFDSITVAPGVKANGRLTLGENIADQGGLKVAMAAFKKATEDKALQSIEGFSPEQRFYISYAGVWAGNIRPEEILVLTKSDPHSLARWRVNGALPQLDHWYETFKITEQSPLFVPKEKRASVW